MRISNADNLLTKKQVDLLKQSASKPFMLGDFVSLDDILTKLKVGVFIEPGKPERVVDSYYDKAIEYWRKVYDKLYEMSREDESLREECQKAEIKLGKLNSERKAHSQMSLLGLYDNQKNTIKLFPEAMVAADANKMDEYLVSTLAHEVMHAYFNRPQHEKYPYAMFVEEPLAEFGMLLYLHETHSQYYNWAHGNVSSKKCCYGYGANIMDQYLGGDKSLRKYLEEYKIFIGEYEMLDEMNGNVSLPMAGSFVNVGAQPISANWTPVHSIPPTFFWDDATKTLGLNGDWRFEMDYFYHRHLYDMHSDLLDIQHLYLGKDFVKGRHNYHLEDLFTSVPVTVSPQHKELTSVNGIPVLKEDNTPVIESCGDGYYELKRNGKYGIIDSQLNPITPFQYDCIWRFDKNGLCQVRIDGKYGLVNKQGKEQVPVIYDNITEKGRFYEVKLNGEVFIIDKLGNKQPEKEK